VPFPQEVCAAIRVFLGVSAPLREYGLDDAVLFRLPAAGRSRSF
jgi:hypothetical protein